MVFEQNYETDGTPTVIEVQYQSPTNEQAINCIFIEDPEDDRSKRIFKDVIKVVKGGINEDNVTLQIKTVNKKPGNYRVAIYAQDVQSN